MYQIYLTLHETKMWSICAHSHTLTGGQANMSDKTCLSVVSYWNDKYAPCIEIQDCFLKNLKNTRPSKKQVAYHYLKIRWKRVQAWYNSQLPNNLEQLDFAYMTPTPF